MKPEEILECYEEKKIPMDIFQQLVHSQLDFFLKASVNNEKLYDTLSSSEFSEFWQIRLLEINSSGKNFSDYRTIFLRALIKRSEQAYKKQPNSSTLTSIFDALSLGIQSGDTYAVSNLLSLTKKIMGDYIDKKIIKELLINIELIKIKNSKNERTQNEKKLMAAEKLARAYFSFRHSFFLISSDNSYIDTMLESAIKNPSTSKEIQNVEESLTVVKDLTLSINKIAKVYTYLHQLILFSINVKKTLEPFIYALLYKQNYDYMKIIKLLSFFIPEVSNEYPKQAQECLLSARILRAKLKKTNNESFRSEEAHSTFSALLKKHAIRRDEINFLNKHNIEINLNPIPSSLQDATYLIKLNNAGFTPFLAASMGGAVDVVTWLIKVLPEDEITNEKTKEELNALELAKINGYANIINYMVVEDMAAGKICYELGSLASRLDTGSNCLTKQELSDLKPNFLSIYNDFVQHADKLNIELPRSLEEGEFLREQIEFVFKSIRALGKNLLVCFRAGFMMAFGPIFGNMSDKQTYAKEFSSLVNIQSIYTELVDAGVSTECVDEIIKLTNSYKDNKDFLSEWIRLEKKLKEQLTFSNFTREENIIFTGISSPTVNKMRPVSLIEDSSWKRNYESANKFYNKGKGAFYGGDKIRAITFFMQARDQYKTINKNKNIDVDIRAKSQKRLDNLKGDESKYSLTKMKKM